MTVKFRIAKQGGSKPIHVFLVALCAFNLGRYSEHFSGSGWGWGALVLNVLLLCWLLYSIISDCQREATRLTKARHVFSRTRRDLKMR